MSKTTTKLPGVKRRGKPSTASTGRTTALAAARKTRKFAVEAARMMTDYHCEDALVLDVRGKSDVTDYIVIVSGTSEVQIRSVGHRVMELAKEMGLSAYTKSPGGSGKWVVLDYVDVIVHVFDPVTRGHYDLEMMWGDVPQVRWRRVKKPAAKAPE
ncbi:MAG: ribosome silencing factor [Phycisphaeraceae bacterium]